MLVIDSGVEPTEIIYNRTSLNVLEYNGVKYWGKPFALNLNAGANSTITVERTSSPNQHASTGYLTTGSLVYYGDVLKISATPSTDYKLTTFTVNGTAWTSGNTITVESAVTVVTVTEVAAQWRTVWTGTIAFNGSGEGQDVSQTVSGVIANLPTRVTGETGYRKGILATFTKVGSFSEILLEGKTNVGRLSSDIEVYGYIYAPTVDNQITANVSKILFNTGAIQLTKVEQYY